MTNCLAINLPLKSDKAESSVLQLDYKMVLVPLNFRFPYFFLLYGHIQRNIISQHKMSEIHLQKILFTADTDV